MQIVRFVLLLLFVCALAMPADADTLDLTTPGSSGTLNGAFFTTNMVQPTGTGVIDPFLRIQANNTEAGFNADYSNSYLPNFDEKTGIWTHSVPISSLSATTINGTTYFQFLLDINQAAASPLLSLDAVQIFASPTANPAQNNLGTLVFDMDVGPQGDSVVLLNYLLNSGSGSGDIWMFIPAANFTGHSGFMIFYTEFGGQGRPFKSNDGFEEWAVVTGSSSPTTPVPEPASLLLLGTGMLALGQIVRTRARIRMKVPS